MTALKTVSDLYTYAKANSIKMLSDYSGTWWADYVTNYANYDKAFCRMYKSFVISGQTGEETTQELLTEFAAQVKIWLQLNDKRYAELYRIHTLADASYSITENYDMTETMDKDVSRSSSLSTGSQTNTAEKEIAGFNSSTYSDADKETHVLGARSDSSSGTEGEEYTLTRKGNIGTMTVTDMLKKHMELWDPYAYMTAIWGAIAAEFLEVE